MSRAAAHSRGPAGRKEPLKPAPARQPDAHLESSLPVGFFWLLDAASMALAFALALFVAPRLQGLVAPGGVLRTAWLSWLVLPGGLLQDAASVANLWAVPAVMVPVALAVMHALGGYRDYGRERAVRIAVTSAAGPLAGLSVFALAAFLLHSERWSRIFVVVYTLGCVLLIAALHLGLHTYKRRRLVAGRYARAAALVGAPRDLLEARTWLSGSGWDVDYRVAGAFRLASQPPFASDVPDLGSVDQIESTLVHTPIDLIIVILPGEDVPWLAPLVRACDYFGVAVHLVPAALMPIAASLRDLQASASVGPSRLPSISLQPWRSESTALFMKRLFDATVAAILLVLLSPVFLLIAVAIKITTPREAVLHQWDVVGYRGRRFRGYKFTTMVGDADRRRAQLMHLNEMTGPVFKIKDDPRVTPLGRFLRKFSLNELPQIWSVLKGDMSLVGPRPAGSWEIGGYEDWHKRKLSVRPGITCLWQVRGRNKISSFDDWVRMDLEYIDNWSFWLDMKILAKTAWAVVAGSGS